MSTFNTLFIGKVAHHYACLDSTNDFAIDLIAKTKPIEGTVISTDFQMKGKGQIGRSWFSSSGENLLLSIILHPKWLEVQKQFLLSQAVALAVADTVSELISVKAEVKWPNDVYVNNNKVAGILIQSSLTGNKISWTVIGIGLNVNEQSFPPQLPMASSLKKITDKEFKLEEVQWKLYQNLEQRYLQLKSRPKEIAAYYLQNLYQFQTWANYQDVKTGKIFRGQIIGVNNFGRLAVQKEDTLGKVEYFDLKEIVFL